MNCRRLCLAAAFVVAVAVSVALAGPPVTVVLTNGQQYNGSLAGSNNGVITLDIDGQQRTFSQSQVGVIEFNGEQPTPRELQQVTNLAGNRPSFLRNVVITRNVVLVLQNGQMIAGALAGISNDGNQIRLTTQAGQTNYFANDIARLYPSPSSARNLQNLYTYSQGYGYPNQGAVGTSGQLMQTRTITVPANQRWVRTGISVQQGQRVTFQVSGEIHYNGDPRSAVGPRGGGIGQDVAQNYPIPTAGVGALIARVGNSQPFLIGDFAEPLAMPASGELYLGINDNIYNDNTGSFTVQVSPAGRN